MHTKKYPDAFPLAVGPASSVRQSADNTKSKHPVNSDLTYGEPKAYDLHVEAYSMLSFIHPKLRPLPGPSVGCYISIG